MDVHHGGHVGDRDVVDAQPLVRAGRLGLEDADIQGPVGVDGDVVLGPSPRKLVREHGPRLPSAAASRLGGVLDFELDGRSPQVRAVERQRPGAERELRRLHVRVGVLQRIEVRQPCGVGPGRIVRRFVVAVLGFDAAVVQDPPVMVVGSPCCRGVPVLEPLDPVKRIAVGVGRGLVPGGMRIVGGRGAEPLVETFHVVLDDPLDALGYGGLGDEVVVVRVRHRDRVETPVRSGAEPDLRHQVGGAVVGCDFHGNVDVARDIGIGRTVRQVGEGDAGDRFRDRDLVKQEPAVRIVRAVPDADVVVIAVPDVQGVVEVILRADVRLCGDPDPLITVN